MTEKIFNSLEIKKSLERVGVPTAQAEKHIEIMGKIINTHLATKDDLKIEALQLRKDMATEFAAVRAEVAAFKTEVKAEFAAVRLEMATGFATVRAEMSADRLKNAEQFALLQSKILQIEARVGEVLDRKLGWGFALLAILMTILKYL